MRILHTSDLHLCSDRPRSVEALEAIIHVATEHKVDLLTIAGDIFDSPAAASDVRPRVRSLMSDCPFEILAIPGNHDGAAFLHGFDFGFRVATGRPFENVQIGDVSIAAVPYTDDNPEDVLPALKQAASSSGNHLMLVHCTLDIGFERSFYGEEISRKYFPVSRAVLADLGYDFILAGHFHKDCRIIALSDSSKFVYPGSPVSHSKKETGARHVVLIDTGRMTVSEIKLPTYYFDSMTVNLVPGQEEAQIGHIAEWYKKHDRQDRELEIIVQGFVAYNETKLVSAIRESAPDASVVSRIRDVTDVLTHPLYERFCQHLVEFSKEDRDEMSRIIMETMSGLLVGGALRE